MMDLALMRPGTPRYWIPFLSKMVAPAWNQGICLVPSRSSGTTQPALQSQHGQRMALHSAVSGGG